MKNLAIIALFVAFISGQALAVGKTSTDCIKQPDLDRGAGKGPDVQSVGVKSVKTKTI